MPTKIVIICSDSPRTAAPLRLKTQHTMKKTDDRSFDHMKQSPLPGYEMRSNCIAGSCEASVRDDETLIVSSFSQSLVQIALD